LANNTEQHNADRKRLEEMLRSVGPDVTPSPGFKQKLLGQLVAKAQDGVSDAKPRRGRKRAVIIRIATAAAACLIFAVGFYFLAVGSVRDASADFAEMLAQVRSANSVSFDFKYTLPGEPQVRGRAYMKHPGQIRIIWPGGKIQIVDATRQKILILRPNVQKATFFKAKADANYAADPLKKLRQAGDSAGTLLGREMLAGQMVDVYQVALSEGSMKVWVEPQEEFPVRIESRLASEDGPAGVIVIDQLRWNRAIPASLFALDVPPGYTVECPQSQPTEESLIALMRICTDISDGVFPADMNAKAVLSLFVESKSCKMQTIAVGDKTAVAMDTYTRGIYKTCLRGLAFVTQYKENGSWHYAGGGLRRGDKNAPVCWWQPAGSETFRVMFGDLQIRDIPADQLPMQSKDVELNNE